MHSGPITLRPIGAQTVQVFASLGGQGMSINGDGGTITLYRNHVPQQGPTYMWHPAHWWGIEYRTDEVGRSWSRVLPRQVQDDYGYLVEVPQ